MADVVGKEQVSFGFGKLLSYCIWKINCSKRNGLTHPLIWRIGSLDLRKKVTVGKGEGNS